MSKQSFGSSIVNNRISCYSLFSKNIYLRLEYIRSNNNKNKILIVFLLIWTQRAWQFHDKDHCEEKSKSLPICSAHYVGNK